MRFIHTADWHLGRLFHGVHLTEDQGHVLAQLVELARDARPDAILVAGDIYDRAVPPPDAVELLDWVLSELVLGLEVPVVLISGNHDSPGRLAFGSRLLAGRRLYVTGSLPATVEPLVLADAHGPVHVYAVPYAEPAVVRACLGYAAADHDAAMRATLDRIRAGHTSGERRVLVAHAFVAGGSGCESERPLSVGGAGTVGADAFRGFHYAALGHLHAPQSLCCDGDGDGDKRLHYAGSLLKYSFDEADHHKHVYVVDMDGQGECTQEAVWLRPRRDVRRVAGLMADLLTGPPDGTPRDDYLEVTLLDDGPVLDAIGQLREVYPNVMAIRRPDHAGGTASDRPNVRTTSDADLFKSFFKHVTGNDATAGQMAAFAATVDAMAAADREVELDEITLDVAPAEVVA